MTDSVPVSAAATPLAVGTIRTDGGTQARAEVQQATVAEYVAAMTAGATFPPVVVYHDGTDYWLSDGFHRLAAVKALGGATIAAEVRQGTRREAVLHACSANATHGLRRTNADKRRAVETLLRDPDWQQWSNHEIGRRCAVDPKTVAAVRQELETTGEIPSVTQRQAADGRVMNTEAIGVGQSVRPPAATGAPVLSVTPTPAPAGLPPALLTARPVDRPAQPAPAAEVLVEIDESEPAAPATDVSSAPAAAPRLQALPAGPAQQGAQPGTAPALTAAPARPLPPPLPVAEAAAAPAAPVDPALAARKLLTAKRALLAAALAQVEAELERTGADTLPRIVIPASRAEDSARVFLAGPVVGSTAGLLAFSAIVEPAVAQEAMQEVNA